MGASSLEIWTGIVPGRLPCGYYPFCSDSPEWRSAHMCTWFSASWRRFRYDRKCLFSCSYNPQITISPASLFSANFNGNRVKNHPQRWTCPLRGRCHCHCWACAAIWLMRVDVCFLDCEWLQFFGMIYASWYIIFQVIFVLAGNWLEFLRIIYVILFRLYFVVISVWIMRVDVCFPCCVCADFAIFELFVLALLRFIRVGVYFQVVLVLTSLWFMRVGVYFQVVFVLTSVWFMRASVYFPGCVRADIGVIYARSCLFLGCVCADFTMIYASWCIFPGSVAAVFPVSYASWCLFSRLCVWWWSLLYIDVCINRITRQKRRVCSRAEYLEQTHYVFVVVVVLSHVIPFTLTSVWVMRVGFCLPGCVRFLFTRLCSCWLRCDLCELAFVYQVVFVLASVWFMWVGVCLPCYVGVAFGMFYASWCLFSR